jgi:hypothetical protein
VQLLGIIAVVLAVLALISFFALLQRIAVALERIADAGTVSDDNRSPRPMSEN